MCIVRIPFEHEETGQAVIDVAAGKFGMQAGECVARLPHTGDAVKVIRQNVIG
jgi:hypothetical protein